MKQFVRPESHIDRCHEVAHLHRTARPYGKILKTRLESSVASSACPGAVRPVSKYPCEVRHAVVETIGACSEDIFQSTCELGQGGYIVDRGVFEKLRQSLGKVCLSIGLVG